MIHEKSDNWHVKSSHLYLYHVKGHEQRWLRTYVIQNQNVFISMSTIFIFCFISLSFFSIFEIPFKCKKINFFYSNTSYNCINLYMHIYVYLYICEEDLVDVGCNADIYVANQESTDSIHEVHVGDALFAFNGSSQDLFQFRSLSLD